MKRVLLVEGNKGIGLLSERMLIAQHFVPVVVYSMESAFALLKTNHNFDVFCVSADEHVPAPDIQARTLVSQCWRRIQDANISTAFSLMPVICVSALESRYRSQVNGEIDEGNLTQIMDLLDETVERSLASMCLDDKGLAYELHISLHALRGRDFHLSFVDWPKLISRILKLV